MFCNDFNDHFEWTHHALWHVVPAKVAHDEAGVAGVGGGAEPGDARASHQLAFLAFKRVACKGSHFLARSVCEEEIPNVRLCGITKIKDANKSMEIPAVPKCHVRRKQKKNDIFGTRPQLASGQSFSRPQNSQSEMILTSYFFSFAIIGCLCTLKACSSATCT